MLVPNEIFNKIDDIVEHAYVDFTYQILGDEFFTEEQKIQIESLGLLVGRRPLIELLYMLVRQRSEERYQTNQTLESILNQVIRTGVLPIVDSEEATLANGKSSFNKVIEDAKASVKKRINQVIIDVNKEEKAFMTLNPVIPPVERQERDQNLTKTVVAAVGAALVLAHKDFTRLWTSELTDFVNNTAIDQIKTVVDEASKVKDQIVYKRVVNDGSLCQWCRSFYLNEDGSPKLYKLKELVANGSNQGKPKSQWKPTVDSTHPRCRCQLHIKVNTQ